MKRSGHVWGLAGIILAILFVAHSVALGEEQPHGASTGRVVTGSKFHPIGLWPLERGTNEFVLSLAEHRFDPGAAYVYVHQTEGPGRTYQLSDTIERQRWRLGRESREGNLLMLLGETFYTGEDGVTSSVLLLKDSWDDVSDVLLTSRERLPNLYDATPLASVPVISTEGKFLASAGYGRMTFHDEERWGGPSDYFMRDEFSVESYFDWVPYLIIWRAEDQTEHDFEDIDLVSDLVWGEDDKSVSGISQIPIDWAGLGEEEEPVLLLDFFTIDLEDMTITRERVPLPGSVGMIRHRKAVTYVALSGEAAGQRFLLYPGSREAVRLPDLPKDAQSRHWHFYGDERFAHLADSESGSLLELVEEGRVVLQRQEPQGAIMEDMLVSPDGRRILWLRKRLTLRQLFCGDEFDVVVEDLDSERKETIWQYHCNVSHLLYLLSPLTPNYVWSRDSTKVFLLDYRTKEVNETYVFQDFRLREFIVENP